MVEAFHCAGCFTTCMAAHFSTVEMDNAIQFGIVFGFLEDFRVPVIVPNGPAGLPVSFNIGRQDLKCEYIALTPTLTL